MRGFSEGIMVLQVVAEEVINDQSGDVAEIARRVKERLNSLSEPGGVLSLIPLDHLVNLVRKRMMQEELPLHQGTARGKEIMEDILRSKQDIEKTRPILIVVDPHVSRN